MKHKKNGVLTVLCALCAVFAVSGCGEETAEQMPEQIKVSDAAVTDPTVPPEYIVFNGESIRLRDYASLISLFGQLSYENVTIEDEADFIDAAEEYDLEHLYNLYNFIDSLPDSEAGKLHRIMIEALNNA